MPQYRLPGMGAGSAVGAGIGSGLSALGEMLFKQNAQARENELLMERQRAEQENAYKNAKLMASINDPFKAAKLGHPELGPTSTDIQKPISADINAADTENKLPTDEGIVNSIRSGGGQITNDPTQLTGGQVGVSTDDFIRQLTTRNSKAEGFKQSELDKPIGYDWVDEHGVKQHAETTVGERQKMGFLPTEQSPQQAASAAGLKSGAEAAATAPYNKPEILGDEAGRAHALKYGPGGAKEIPLPPGLLAPGASQGRPLTGDEVRNVSMINTGEVEGVKVMKALHALGLDKSNDPLDPRWNQFLVQTIGIEPQAWEKADIQQRVAFIQASNLRTLMGGRPAQYIAEIIKQHTPSGKLSGEQLAHVLENVLDQNAEIRGEMSNVMGRQLSTPKTGESWETYLQQNGRPSQGRGVSQSSSAILGR